MIKINLLPFRAARKKENVRRQISIFLLSVVFIIVVMFSVSTFLAARIDHLKGQIDFTNKEIEKYAKINAEIQTIKKNIEVLNKKIEVIKKLEADRIEPVKLIDAMTGLIVANRMWFTNFSSGESTVTIDGIAVDNKTVADFMTRLEQSNKFDAVNLKILKQTTFQQIDMKAFSINCNKINPTPIKNEIAAK